MAAFLQLQNVEVALQSNLVCSIVIDLFNCGGHHGERLITSLPISWGPSCYADMAIGDQVCMFRAGSPSGAAAGHSFFDQALLGGTKDCQRPFCNCAAASTPSIMKPNMACYCLH
jgi:hypothetical protein